MTPQTEGFCLCDIICGVMRGEDIGMRGIKTSMAAKLEPAAAGSDSVKSFL